MGVALGFLGLLWFFLLRFGFGSNKPGLNEVFEKNFVWFFDFLEDID